MCGTHIYSLYVQYNVCRYVLFCCLLFYTLTFVVLCFADKYCMIFCNSATVFVSQLEINIDPIVTSKGHHSRLIVIFISAHFPQYFSFVKKNSASETTLHSC